MRYRWFKFWWMLQHRYWADSRQKRKQLEKDWQAYNQR